MNYKKISKFISLGIRIAALILVVIFFVPTICVSCQGEESTEISGFAAAVGNIDSEDVDAEAKPVLFVIPALALLIAALGNKLHIISAIAAEGNIIAMILMKNGVQKMVEERFDEFAGYITVETTNAYTIHMVVCVVIVIALLVDKFYFHRKALRVENSAKIVLQNGDVDVELTQVIPRDIPALSDPNTADDSANDT